MKLDFFFFLRKGLLSRLIFGKYFYATYFLQKKIVIFFFKHFNFSGIFFTQFFET